MALTLCLLAMPAAASVSDEVKRLLRLSDFEAAAAELRRVADRGDADAAYELAKIYLRGHAKKPPGDGPARRFEQAAVLAHDDAAYQLGRLYERGTTVPANRELALRWYREAVILEHVKARNAIERLSVEDLVLPITMNEALATCGEKQIRNALGSNKPFDPSWMFKALDCGGSVGLFKDLIKAGHDVAAVDSAGNTALHVAVARDEANAVSALLAAGADRGRKNANGWSAEMLAQRSANASVRELFMLREQVAEKQHLDLQRASGEARFKGWPPLAIAAWHGDGVLTQRLLRTGADVNLAGPNGYSALDRALQRDELEIAELLLKADAALNDRTLKLLVDAENAKTRLISASARQARAQGRAGTLLCKSLIAGNFVLAEAVMVGGTKSEACDGVSPLVLAAKSGTLRLVTEIAQTADINSADEAGCSALCWALRKEHLDIAHFLLMKGADNRADGRGETPLMLAAYRGDLGGVQLLVERDSNVNQQSQSGTHALILAAAGGHYGVVEYLLEQKAVIDQKDGVGDTALIIAVREDNLEVARLLVANGASTRARNEKFESARELVKTKSPSWREVIEEESSMWGLVN